MQCRIWNSKLFEKRWSYPHALGAIDGTHITIRNPKDGGSFHYYHKHTDSIPNSDIFLYVSLCDDAFALKKFMLKPYPKQNLTIEKMMNNYRHSQARRISKNLFCNWANRRRICSTRINLVPRQFEKVFLSVLALQNMLIKNLDSASVYRPG